MRCGFCFCIYNGDGMCLLDEIEINDIGLCDMIEFVDIPCEVLQEHKNRRLQELEDEDFDL